MVTRELGKTWIGREMGQRVKDFVDVLCNRRAIEDPIHPWSSRAAGTLLVSVENLWIHPARNFGGK